MTIAYRDSASAAYNGTDATSKNITIPSTVQVGDVMILGATSNSAGAPGTPTGWTSIQSWSGTFSNHALFYKVAVSGDAGSTVTVSIGGSGRLSLGMSCYSGANTPTGFAKSTESSSSTITHPSVTATASTARLVCGLNMYVSSSSTTETVGSPLTSRVAQTCVWTHVALGDQALSASGATGTRTSTVTSSAFSGYAWSLLLEPAVTSQTINVGGATETDTGRAVTVLGTKTVAAGRATQTASARAVTAVPGAVAVAAGRATQATTARPLTALSPSTIPTGRATQVAAGRAITVVANTSVAAGRATETDFARPIAGSGATIVAVARASEADAARSITVVLAALQHALARSTETDAARLLTVSLGALNTALSRTLETDAARVINLALPARTLTVGRAAESDTARPAAVAVVVGVARATETDTARPVVPPITLSRATETDAARTVRPVVLVTVGRATTTQTARPLVLVERFAVGRAWTTHAAYRIKRAKIHGGINRPASDGELVGRRHFYT